MLWLENFWSLRYDCMYSIASQKSTSLNQFQLAPHSGNPECSISPYSISFKHFMPNWFPPHPYPPQFTNLLRVVDFHSQPHHSKLILMVQCLKKIGEARVVAVIWKNQGMVLASMSKRLALPRSVVNVEVMVANKALDFVHDIVLSSIILEGDSEVVIQALRSEEKSLASYVHLIANAKSILEAFNFISFSHIRRL